MRALHGSVKVIPSNFYARAGAPHPSHHRTLSRQKSPIEDTPLPGEILQLAVSHPFPRVARGWQQGPAVPHSGRTFMPAPRSRLMLALLLVLPGALAAQRVSADIVIGHGPIAGRVIMGDPYPYHPRTIVEVHPYHRDRPVYREVVVVHRPRGHDWYRRHGYRTVRMWYDAGRGRYYQHHDRNHPGLRAVVVYERGGRYYSEDRYQGDGREGRHAGRGADRWEHD